MQVFLTSNGLLISNGEKAAFFSNTGELRRSCALDEFNFVSDKCPKVDINQLGNGEFIGSIEHDFENNVEHVQTRFDWFMENLRYTETAEGNLIEDYDTVNHSVLIRCKQEDCNCVGHWWEPAQIHFPSKASNVTDRTKIRKIGGNRERRK